MEENVKENNTPETNIQEANLSETNAPEPTNQKTQGLTKKKKRMIITISIIVAIFLIGIWGIIFSIIPKSEKEEENKTTEFSAWPYARNFLSQYVKFSDTLIVLNKTETITRYSDYNLWSYKGDFTSENAYGTKIRHNFIVIVKVVDANNTPTIYKYYLQIDDDVYFS